MNDLPAEEASDGLEPVDPGDADVPDLAGELEHDKMEPGGEPEAGGGLEKVSPKAVAILVLIVLAVGAALLWAVLARGPKAVAPPPATVSPAAVAAADAPALFAQNCAGCHGVGGTGPAASGAAPVIAGKGLTAQSVARVVHDGARGMPAFDTRLTDAEIAAVAVYVASLPPPPP